MNFDKDKQAIVLHTMPEYAVALSSLTHGLRVSRINPDVRHDLGADALANARLTRDEMLHHPQPELPFALPFDAAKTAVAGIKCARFRSTNTPESAISRMRRQGIGNLLLTTYQRLTTEISQ